MRHKGTEAQSPTTIPSFSKGGLGRIIRKKHKVKKGESGQLLVAAILGMLVLLIIVPAFVQFVSNESKWTVKEKKTSTAFHLAEAGLDRGFWKLQESPTIWVTLASGPIANYNFDKTYNDITGGTYAIKLSSDPTNSDRRIIEAVGRDSSTQETRKIIAIYASEGASSAIRANQTVGIAASVDVDWGPIIAGTSINTGGAIHPRYKSAGNITPQDTNGITAPNSDDVQWWSFTSIPAMPVLDFDFYKSSAIAAGAPSDSDCGSSYYATGNRTFTGCTDLNWRTFYIEGNATFASGGSEGNHIRGNVIVMGDISFSGNGGSNNTNGVYSATVPPLAWQEYGNNWARYQTFDSTAPVSYAAADSSNYVASGVTYGVSNILVHGLLYTGGSTGLNGGGNGRLHGVLITGTNATLTTSNFAIWYDDTVTQNIKLSNIIITLQEWKEVPGAGTWPL